MILWYFHRRALCVTYCAVVCGINVQSTSTMCMLTIHWIAYLQILLGRLFHRCFVLPQILRKELHSIYGFTS